MKYKFTTKDPIEAKRLTKATDMACALFEILYNTKKHIAHTITDETTAEDILELTFEEIWKEVNKHDINLEDILE